MSTDSPSHFCHSRPVILQFAMVECVVTGLSDEYPKYLRKYKPFFLIAVCVMMFLLAIPMCAQVETFYAATRETNSTFRRLHDNMRSLKCHIFIADFCLKCLKTSCVITNKCFPVLNESQSINHPYNQTSLMQMTEILTSKLTLYILHIKRRLKQLVFHLEYYRSFLVRVRIKSLFH